MNSREKRDTVICASVFFLGLFALIVGYGDLLPVLGITMIAAISEEEK